MNELEVEREREKRHNNNGLTIKMCCISIGLMSPCDEAADGHRKKLSNCAERRDLT